MPDREEEDARGITTRRNAQGEAGVGDVMEGRYDRTEGDEGTSLRMNRLSREAGVAERSKDIHD